MNRTIEIGGNHGVMTVDATTGEVLHLDVTRADEPDEYADIICFDLQEWHETYPGETCHGGDILDFGFWADTGEYFEPTDDWRKDYLAGLKDGSLGQIV